MKHNKGRSLFCLKTEIKICLHENIGSNSVRLSLLVEVAGAGSRYLVGQSVGRGSVRLQPAATPGGQVGHSRNMRTIPY